MYIDLTTDEIIKILENGSTNQQNFINLCRKYGAHYDAIEAIEQAIYDEILFNGYDSEPYDIRGNINGGALYVAEEKPENENYLFIIAELVERKLYLISE